MEQENNQNIDVDKVAAPDEVIETLKKELNEFKTRAESNLAGWQRAQADFINYKRRSEQEREETVKFGNSMLLLNILPVLDDFERAIGSIPDDLKEHPWAEGIRLIDKNLRGILEKQGLSPIKAIGEPFDPRLHEAVREDKGKEGFVLAEMQRGYRFQDRVIRPSKVVVGSGEENSPAGNSLNKETEKENSQ